ncbi:TRNP1 isoform 3 [Pongo abelii]|uniref:TRNP1 isoform 3 n=1 Tax=Pongo abelii TaxID=9601 RepID=A0A2J8SI84_PONAB|nr:TRNP1 isoform 3 [Pongo abelii]
MCRLGGRIQGVPVSDWLCRPSLRPCSIRCADGGRGSGVGAVAVSSCSARPAAPPPRSADLHARTPGHPDRLRRGADRPTDRGRRLDGLRIRRKRQWGARGPVEEAELLPTPQSLHSMDLDLWIRLSPWALPSGRR